MRVEVGIGDAAIVVDDKRRAAVPLGNDLGESHFVFRGLEVLLTRMISLANFCDV
jgi:hypothetical protein